MIGCRRTQLPDTTFITGKECKYICYTVILLKRKWCLSCREAGFTISVLEFGSKCPECGRSSVICDILQDYESHGCGSAEACSAVEKLFLSQFPRQTRSMQPWPAGCNWAGKDQCGNDQLTARSPHFPSLNEIRLRSKLCPIKIALDIDEYCWWFAIAGLACRISEQIGGQLKRGILAMPRTFQFLDSLMSLISIANRHGQPCWIILSLWIQKFL